MPKNTVEHIENISEIDRVKDGVVFLKGGGLRKVVMVSGVNFNLKSEEEQEIIISSFQNFLNSLDFSVQINVRSRKVNINDYLNKINERAVEEMNPLLKTQIEQYRDFIAAFISQNAIMEKSFFVIIPFDPVVLPSVKIPGKKKKPETETDNRLEYNLTKLNQNTDRVMRGLRQMGLRSVTLEDEELFDLYHSFYSPGQDSLSPPRSIAETLPEKMEIFPSSLKLDGLFCRTVAVLSYPRFLSTGWLSSMINMPEIMDIAIHISPADTGLMLKKLRARATGLEAQLSEMEEKGMTRDPMIETALGDIEALRDALQQSTEKLFHASLYFSFYSASEKQLNDLEEKINSVLESQLLSARPPLFEQLKAFNAVLPIGKDELEINAPMNTSPLSLLFPFDSISLTSDEGVLYGINLHNNTLVIFDRFSMENANTVIFAKAGAGKSYATKLEIIRSLMFGTDILIIDPENEYQTLAKTFGGTIVEISLNSQNRINPFDIPVIPEGEDPGEILKSHFVNLAGLLKLMLGEITSAEEALIDRAITETYASRDITFDKDFSGATPPLLEDLETILRNIEGGEEMADRLYRFTKGSFAGFVNMPTNVDAKNRLVVFSIRDLEEELRPIAMYAILNFIWNQIRSELKKRIMVVDEAWWMMKYPDSAAFLFGLAKRARKYYLGITTITQDVEDFLSSPYGRPIITNSSIQLLLRQSPATIEATGKAFGLTEAEKNFLVEVDVGAGLFLAGLSHAAIQIVSSPFEHQIITTDPEEILQQYGQGGSP
jgi:conjugal transfer ATP-binding protein TraC